MKMNTESPESLIDLVKDIQALLDIHYRRRETGGKGKEQMEKELEDKGAMKTALADLQELQVLWLREEQLRLQKEQLEDSEVVAYARKKYMKQLHERYTKTKNNLIRGLL